MSIKSRLEKLRKRAETAEQETDRVYREWLEYFTDGELLSIADGTADAGLLERFAGGPPPSPQYMREILQMITDIEAEGKFMEGWMLAIRMEFAR